jgi:hypothetical protein
VKGTEENRTETKTRLQGQPKIAVRKNKEITRAAREEKKKKE